MKKLLLTVFCLFSIMSFAVADEAKFDFTNPSGLTPSITDDMFSGTTTEGAYEFGTSGTTFTNNGVTINTTNGSTTISRIWKAASGKYDLRLYKTATMTIAAPQGETITSIVFAGNEVGSFSANNGTIDGKNWSGSAEEVVFTCTKTQKINTITVTFGDGTAEPDNGGNEEPEEEMDITTIDNVAVDAECKILGTVVAVNAKSFLVEDETSIILVYMNDVPGVANGDEVTVQGTISTYAGMLQFSEGSKVVKTGNKNNVTYPEVTVLNADKVGELFANPDIQYVEYSGKLSVSGNYYNVAIENTTVICSITYPTEEEKKSLTDGSVITVTGYTTGAITSKDGGTYLNTIATEIEVTEAAPGGSEGDNNEDNNDSDNSTATAYTVAEAIAAYVEGEKIPAIVTGYIVGTINGQVYNEGCVFSGTAETNTNLLIADNADETDYSKCIPVQLPKTAIRDELNLVDNPQNYKKKVALTGSIEKYFGIAGLKNTSAYEFINENENENENGNDNDNGNDNENSIKSVEAENGNAVIFDLTGRKVNNIATPGIYIVNGKKVLVK